MTSAERAVCLFSLIIIIFWFDRGWRAQDVVPLPLAQQTHRTPTEKQAFQPRHPEVRRKRSTMMSTKRRDVSPESNSGHSSVGNRSSVEPSSLGSLPTSIDGHSRGKNEPSAAVQSIRHDKGFTPDTLSTQDGTLALLGSHSVTLEDISLQNLDAVLDQATRPPLRNDRPGGIFLNAISPEKSSMIKYERELDGAKISIGDSPSKCLTDLPEDFCDKGLPDATTDNGPMTETCETATKAFDLPNLNEPQEAKSNQLITNDILIAYVL